MGASNGYIYQGEYIQPTKVRPYELNQEQSYDYEKVFGKIGTDRAIDGSVRSSFIEQGNEPALPSRLYHAEKCLRQMQNRHSQKSIGKKTTSMSNILVHHYQQHRESPKSQEKMNLLVDQEKSSKVKEVNSKVCDNDLPSSKMKRAKSYVEKQIDKGTANPTLKKKSQVNHKISELSDQITALKSLINRRVINGESQKTQDKDNRSEKVNETGSRKRNHSQINPLRKVQPRRKAKLSETQIDDYSQIKSKHKYSFSLLSGCKGSFHQYSIYDAKENSSVLSDLHKETFRGIKNEKGCQFPLGPAQNHADFVSIQSIKHEPKIVQENVKPFTIKPTCSYFFQNDTGPQPGGKPLHCKRIIREKYERNIYQYTN